MTDFKSTLRQVFDEERLSTERMSIILKDTEKTRYYRSKSTFWYSAAAAVVIFCFFGIFSIYRNNLIKNSVLHEIAANHLRQLKSEVLANSYAEISRKLDMLKMPIKPPNEPVDNFYLVNGARYSSIRGGLAAQIYLVNKMRNHPHTMYVTHLTKDLEALQSDFYEMEGVHIKIWKNDSCMYAIARTMADKQKDVK